MTTHAELALLRDHEDWDALWPIAEEHAKHATLALMDDEPDSDTLQEAYEAAIHAMRDWEPVDHAFSTHINMRVQGRIRDYLRQVQTGGIGTEWTIREGIGAEHQTLAKPIGEAAEEDDDPPTWLNNLTYQDTGNVPAGYGDVGHELQDQHIVDEITYLLHGLDPAEVDVLRKVVMGEMGQVEYAELMGEDQSTVSRRIQKALKTAHKKTETSLMEYRGVRDWKGLRSHYPAARRFRGFWNDVISVVQNNPIWSEVTGKVWNDWAWRPDIVTEAAFKRWTLGVSRRKRATRKEAEAA